MPIRKATTAGTRGLICLYSESGGGKTYSALLLARGMAGPTGKIVLIDTENRRGEIYADDPKIGGYDVLPLSAPFGPANYSAAIQEAEEYGADVIVVDSGSHEWEGPGGVLDMAASASRARAEKYGRAWNGATEFGDWNKPKMAHKQLVARLQRSSAHVIVCLRAQYKSHQIEQKDYAKHNITSNQKTTIIRDQFQSPIQDASFIFEMMVHLQMSNKNPGVPHITKCPDMLLDVFDQDRMMTVATGAKIAKFYESGAPTNQAVAELIKSARKEAAKGLAAYQKFFGGITADQRRELVNLGEHEALKTRLETPIEEPGVQARERQQDPPAEPTDDGRPDHGDDDFPGDSPGFADDDNPGNEPGYNPPNFDQF